MEWMFKEDEYTPSNDKNNFIDKSIFSILGVLSRIKSSNTNKENFIYNIKCEMKLISTILIVVLVSLSTNYKFIIGVGIYLLTLISSLDKCDIKKILSISIVVPIFTFITLIPSIYFGGNYHELLIVGKVFITILTTSILSYTTMWNEIVRSLKLIHIPDIFILIMEITLRYIFILGKFSLDMFYSLKLRSIGKNSNKYKYLSGMIGTLFLKSKKLGDELYFAMECRGFQGEFNRYSNYRISLTDLAYSLANIIIFLMFIVFI
ncbi:cobalt transport protein [Gottschalkia purinilytica]|uniref:Cobalt transport protein n=1 Tax=Gottschalkia purinilytica TaxID=1503 RepID=A0A0L0W7Z8_GOTPU|nr:energy-coupling factor transporter transmembrane component T [Gottschalkia purinilytica]KNF07698.1 cobalt transport protein [Gottschalkia purinilytica]